MRQAIVTFTPGHRDRHRRDEAAGKTKIEQYMDSERREEDESQLDEGIAA